MSTPAEQINLSPEVRQQLRNSFLSSFGQWEALDEMLLLQMGERLETLVARGNMSNVTFNLFFCVVLRTIRRLSKRELHLNNTGWPSQEGRLCVRLSRIFDVCDLKAV